jgi:hypothetical protein
MLEGEFVTLHLTTGAWGGVVVKELRYCRRVPGSIPSHWGFFSGALDSSMCPGFDSASKNEYQDILGAGDDLTTFMCRVSRNLPETPKGLFYIYIKTLYYSSFCIVTAVARRKVGERLAYRKWKKKMWAR